MHHNFHGRSKSFVRNKQRKTTPRIVLPQPVNYKFTKNRSRYDRYGKPIKMHSGGGGASHTKMKLFKGMSLLRVLGRAIDRLRNVMVSIFHHNSYSRRYKNKEYRHGKKFRRYHHTSYGRRYYVNHNGVISY